MTHVYTVAGFYVAAVTVTSPEGLVATSRRGFFIYNGSPTNPPALAAADAFTADSGTQLTISIPELLSNDAPGVTFVAIQPAVKCQLDSPTTCVYTAPGLANGALTSLDTFEYRVRDAAGHEGLAPINVTVTRPLAADADEVETDVNQPVLVSASFMLTGDTAGAVFVRAENPQRGTLAAFGEDPQHPELGRRYRFTPDLNFAGYGSFEYLISRDGGPPFARGAVYVHVIDKPPTADFVVFCSNRTCTVTDRSSDTLGIARYEWNWGDGSPLTVATTGVDQTHTYAQSGQYLITLTLTDTGENTSSHGEWVTANSRPVAVADSATTERDIAVTINVLANDSDPDGDALTLYGASFDRPGTVANLMQTAAGWVLRVTPPDSFVGVLNGTYTITDRWAASTTAAVTITVNQWTSITDAVGEQFYCPQTGSVRIPYAQLLANDFDSDGDGLSVVALDTSMLNIDCTSEPNVCNFTASPYSAGVTFFRYTASDPAGHRDSATVRIYVGVRWNTPTAVDDYFTTPRDQSRVFTAQEVIQNDIDSDGDVLQVSGLASGARDYGFLSCTSPMYRCTYTPNAGYVGSERMPYFATDMINATQSAYVNVLMLPPSTPTFDAREDVYVTAVNQPLYIVKAGLAVNDYDPEGDAITVSSVDTSGTGGLTCDASGCNFTPTANWQGTVKFKYTSTDGHGSSDAAVVRIRVGGTNDPPVPGADVRNTPLNTQLRFSVFDLLRNDYDRNNDPLTVTISTSTALKGTIVCGNPQYWCTYTPNANAAGGDVLTYSVSDGTTSASSTVTIFIGP